MNNSNTINPSIPSTFKRGQEPMNYSQAVQQAPAPEPLFSAITVVESPNATDINDRAIANVWSINVEGHAIDFEFIDSASLPFTPAPEEVFYKCAFVNNEPTNPLISDLLFFTPHAIDRMEERQISYAHVLYSLNAIPIESYDNKLVLNNNLESISTVVKLVESVGYIVTTVVRKESPVLNLELLQYDMSLEPIYGDAECNNIEELEQFYQGILADANENPYRQGKAAYNLAKLMKVHFNILNELYLDSWLALIKQAIALGHPGAKALYLDVMEQFLYLLPTEVQVEERKYLSGMEEYQHLPELFEGPLAAQNRQKQGYTYEFVKQVCNQQIHKNPLLAPMLLNSTWLNASNKKPISYTSIFTLFLIKNPEIIIFLLVNHDITKNEICITNKRKKYAISTFFNLKELKEAFENLPRCVQERTIIDTLTSVYKKIIPYTKKENLELCKKILVNSVINYGAKTLEILTVQKRLWELNIQDGIEVVENLTLLINWYIEYINEEQGSALSRVAEELKTPHIVKALQNYPGVVIYQASRILNSLSEEAKGPEQVEALIEGVDRVILQGMNAFMSENERRNFADSEDRKAALELVQQLIKTDTQNFDKDFYFNRIQDQFKQRPTLKAFLFFILAQIIHSAGDIDAAKAMLATAQQYCLQKSSANTRASRRSSEASVQWKKGDVTIILLNLIIKFHDEYGQ